MKKEELVDALKNAVSDNIADEKNQNSLSEESKLIEQSANQGKYYPEKYINSDTKEILKVVREAIRRNEIKFVKSLLGELIAHGREKSLINKIKELLNNSDSSLKDYSNKKYLSSFEKEDLIEIGYSIGLHINPKLTKEQMVNIISEYYSIHKISREID